MKTVFLVLGLLFSVILGLALFVLPWAKFEMFGISNSLPPLKDWIGFVVLAALLGYVVTLLLKKYNLSVIFGGLGVLSVLFAYIRFNGAVGEMPGGSIGMGLWAGLAATVLMTLFAFLLKRKA